MLTCKNTVHKIQSSKSKIKEETNTQTHFKRKHSKPMHAFGKTADYIQTLQVYHKRTLSNDVASSNLRTHSLNKESTRSCCKICWKRWVWNKGFSAARATSTNPGERIFRSLGCTGTSPCLFHEVVPLSYHNFAFAFPIYSLCNISVRSALPRRAKVYALPTWTRATNHERF